MEMRDRLTEVLRKAVINCGCDISSDKITDYLLKYGVTIDVPKFRVGHKVRIINPSSVYSTYSDWVFANVDRDRIGYWDYDQSPKKGATGIIVHIAKHLCRDLEVAYVEIDGMYYVMGIEGLEHL